MPKLTDFQRRVLAATLRGLTVSQIAEELRTSKGSVYNRQRELRVKKALTPDKIQPEREGARMIGNLGGRYREQSPEFKAWVRKNLPEGSTVAQFAVACMLDAFHEEKGAEQ